MARRNRPKHPSRPNPTDRYELDYVHLPQYTNYNRIVVKPMKTVFVNLDADFWADEMYVVRSCNDPVYRDMQKAGVVA